MGGCTRDTKVTRSRRSPDERPVPAATDPGRARFARCPRGRRRRAALSAASGFDAAAVWLADRPTTKPGDIHRLCGLAMPGAVPCSRPQVSWIA